MIKRGVLWIIVMGMGMVLAVNSAAAAPVRAPFPTRDWTTSSAADQGMDPGILGQSHAAIKDSMPHVNGIVVIRHGYLVWEKYYGNYNRNTRHNVMSVTKSVTATLIGIALDKGLIPSVDQPISTYFPEFFPADVDGRKWGITVRNLLMMRSGLAWNEPIPFSPEQANQLHGMGSILGLSMASDPGSTWVYSTGDYHLLSGVLTRATGMKALAFADKYLFRPLGIFNRRWRADSEGYNIGGVDLQMTPRDMAKIGYLYLNNGNWDGQQIVSPGWVSLVTSPQPGMAPTDVTPGYGYSWRVFGLRGHPSYYALGYAGQYIIVVPDLDLVVAMTGYEYVKPDVADANAYASLQVVASYIVPAVTGP